MCKTLKRWRKKTEKINSSKIKVSQKMAQFVSSMTHAMLFYVFKIQTNCRKRPKTKNLNNLAIFLNILLFLLVLILWENLEQFSKHATKISISKSTDLKALKTQN